MDNSKNAGSARGSAQWKWGVGRGPGAGVMYVLIG